MLGLALAGALVAPGAAATSSSGGGQVVFLSDRAPSLGSLSVYVMNGDGSHQRALTRAVPQATDPRWLPAGKGVAFETFATPGDRPLYGGVWFVRRDGSHLHWVIRGLSRLPADPVWSPDGQRMAFVRHHSLFVARADGSRARRVYRSSNVLAAPAWSPDGRRLAVSSGSFGSGNSRVVVLAVGGNSARVDFGIRQPAFEPSWAPDGREIAFIGKTRGSPDLEVVRSDGSRRRRLVSDVWVGLSSRPSWSPDSRRIVIGRVLRGGRQEPISVVDLATGRARMIARSGYLPQWSPSGGTIAFAGQGAAGTYLVRPDGSHPRRLEPFSGLVRFSPDGSRLAIAAGAVFVVKVGGGRLVQLTHPFDDTQAVGSPDHTKVAFVRRFPPDPRTGGPGVRIVYVANADGSGLHRIGFGDSVSWAPDSTRVTFASGGDVYGAAVDGRAAVKLTSGPDYDSSPAWSPNGATIAFTRGLPGSARDVCLVAIPESAPPSCLSAGGGTPAWSPEGTLIAFTIGDRSGPDARVGVIRADGGGQRLVGQGYAPAWAPDGSRLAFIDLSKSSDGMLSVVNADGTGLTELAEPPSLPEEPSWSPDGAVVATTSCPPQLYDCEIWAVATNHSPSRQLTKNIVDDRAPVWWP